MTRSAMLCIVTAKCLYKVKLAIQVFKIIESTAINSLRDIVQRRRLQIRTILNQPFTGKFLLQHHRFTIS